MEGVKSGYLTPRTGVFFCRKLPGGLTKSDRGIFCVLLVLARQIEHFLRHHPLCTIELHIPVDTPT